MDGKYPQNIHLCVKLLIVIQGNVNVSPSYQHDSMRLDMSSGTTGLQGLTL